MRFDVDALHFQGTVEIANDKNNNLYDISLLKNDDTKETKKGINIYFAPTLINSIIERALDRDEEEHKK